MAKNLVIVESPAKAKTIEGYLGKDYKVTSSYGHVRDLPKGDKAIDIKNGFKPTYEITGDKKEVIKELKKLSKDAETIYLASDDDREGEAISWHLKEALKLDETKTKRIVFREITKNAILNAIDHPRSIDLDLVNAQQARRILDRIVGYEISPILWKKIKRGLSAGRVQSVAVRLVVEREREIDAFESVDSFKVSAIFTDENNKEIKAELNKKFKTYDEAVKFLNDCASAKFTISKLETKPSKKSPAPPFTTSTLQQEASRKLGFSVSQTMTLAQRLYESGKISYMRTDSLNLSEEAISIAKNTITSEFGNEYSEVRKYKSKSQGAQEAHEAIRPTDFGTTEAGKDRNEQRLYELIWKRAIASQMADAQIERTIATINISNNNDVYFTATGEIIKFDGFLRVYLESTDDEDEEESKGILPPLKEGQNLNASEIISRQSFTRPPARYSEASLVKKLEEMGIGRPSTYAPTISTVQKRGYVVKESREGKERQYKLITLKGGQVKEQTKTETTGAEKNKLFPTNTAMVVNDFLVEHFPNVTDYSFTANVEKEFDEIAQGMKEWDSMIDAFYGKFHAKVEDTEAISRKEINTSRNLGTDPKTGKPVMARLGKFGPIVQIGDPEDEEKPRYASMRKDQFIESISLEEALELFKLPREIGTYEDEPVSVNIGRFGPYILHAKKFTSLPKEDDPYSVELSRAIELIDEKRKAEANKFIKTFDEDESVQVLNGRYGPYIKVGKQNVKIPKDKKPEELTLKECLELAEEAKNKPKKPRGRKK
ncbi:type I DNA topoisomerase [Marinigracilibium pacificum]|uniref:DNA topoisomerase 1 n=1 Tax=Marinigracilibium pacificum TaxID=2729599 RepID=A0A848IZT3_9BACT|nr:type I DNA topoisomerase [Marinigracilibium pacificum]NMM50053.1 type I DNA topoisomerase [Marinigracilibium pacificum]